MEYQPHIHQVQYYETDQMGIVHHSNYIRWFEEARLDFLEQAELPYDLLEQRGILIPVLEASAKYKMPVRFGEVVSIDLKLEQFNGLKGYFSYEVTEINSKRLCTTGRTGHCFLNEQRQLINLKKSEPKIYEKLLQICQTGQCV